MSIRIGGNEFGVARIQNWNILPNPLGFELALPINTEIKRDFSEEPYADFVNADILVRKEKNKKERLGIGKFEIPIHVRPQTSGSASLFLRLTHDELGRLEDWRQSNDLTFEIHGRAMGYDGSHWNGADLHAEIHVARSSWIDCLTGLGVFRTVYTEIPISEPHGGQTLSTPIKKIESAQRNIAVGEYNAAIRDCRVVLESCGTIIFEEKKWADQAFKPFMEQTTRTQMNADDRKRAIFAACRHYTNLFAHEEDAQLVPEASHEDAKMMVRLAATALCRTREVLK